MSLVEQIKPDQKIKGYYLCKYRQILKNKNGKDYCTMKLQDRTGIVEAKIWAMHSGIETCKVDDIVYIEADTILYQDNLQLNITKLQLAKEGSYNLIDFIPSTPKDIEVLQEQFYTYIDNIQNSAIKKLLEEIFLDEAINKKFIEGAAAKTVHHAYLHGLLEHSISVAVIGENLCHLYPIANKDVVIAGCLLHDLGKIKELSGLPTNDYTDEGQLLGHIIIGYEYLIEKIAMIKDFPHEAAMVLKHILLSHHGEYEYASPKRPKCIEAMIVHLADNADSKLKMFEDMLLQGKEEEQYVGYHKLLGRNIRKVQL